jgi:hypothetical protein
MSAAILAFRARPQVECYFGGCPECGKTNGYINVQAAHWFVCDEHLTKWAAGWNLFSSWKEESEEEHRANARKLSGYRKVKPLYPDGEGYPDLFGRFVPTPEEEESF